MLRAADLGGLGGGRPPVNIQVNFVPGETNAIKEALADAKSLNEELNKSNGLMRNVGQSVGQNVAGGGSSRGGGSPGDVPGRDYSSIDRMIADAQARRAGAARPIMAEFAPAAATRTGGIASAIATPGPAMFAGVAAGAAALGLALHNLAMEVPNLQGALQDWEANLLASISRQLSPQGTTRQIGSAISRKLGAIPIIGGPIGFAVEGGMSLAEGAWNLATGADDVVRTQDNLQRAQQRALFNQIQQRRIDAQFMNGLSTDLTGAGTAGVAVGGLGAQVLTNSQQRRALQSALGATASGDPQAGFQLQGGDRADALLRLREIRLDEVNLARQAHAEGMRAWEGQLEIEKQVLALRQQEKEAVEQSTRRQIEGLAGLSTSELRRTEAAFRSAQDGSVTRREAQLLQRGGLGNLEAVQNFNQDRLQTNAPQILAKLQQALTDARTAEDRQTEALADFVTRMNDVRESGKKVIEEIAAEAIKVAKQLLQEARDAKNDAVDEITAQTTVKGGQISRAPGIRMGGQGL